jgi:hypothetical protein
MSDLQLTFSDVYTKISEFLGVGSSPTGTNLTKVKDLAYRGYRRFLLPKYVRNGRMHVWSFLRQEDTIKTSANEWQYPLPPNFQYFWYAPEYGEDSNYPTPQPVTMRRLMELRSAISSSSYPQYWSLSTMPYDVTVGTRYQLVIHPPANGIHTIHFGYITEPNKPTDDAHYFIGGALMSECILECSLAEAEIQEDDTVGIHNKRADDMLHSCIELDLCRVPKTAGTSNRDMVIWSDPTLARDLRWIEAASSAYGIS